MAERQVAKREQQVQEVAPPVGDAEAILHMIERVARDPEADIDKFERLVAVKERMEQQEREKAFNAAMSAAQAEMAPVVRDRKNTHTHSTYATLEAISEAIRETYTKNGFSLSFGAEPSEIQGHYRIYCICAHQSGFQRRYEADLPADVAGSQGKTNKTAIQGFGSTMSYGRRYLTLLIFNIALKDEDDDGNAAGVETISPEQAIDIRGALEEIAEAEEIEVGATVANFCKYMRVETIDKIPQDQFDKATAALKQKRGAAR